MGALAYIEELCRLPVHQQKVLMPLVTWQISLENPDFDLGSDLRAMVAEFVASLGADPNTLREKLQACLDEAGVSPDQLRALQLRANLPPLPKVVFSPLTPSSEGQVRGMLGVRLLDSKKGA